MIKNVKEDNLRVPSHLTDLLDSCSEDLSTDEKGKVSNLLNKFQEVFSKHEFDIGLTDLVEHSIDTEACQDAFQEIKDTLSSDVIMAYPREEGESILDVDASGHGIGAVLSQIQNQQEKVIAYGSRILNKAERNYCVTDKELLALRYFVEYYRQYLLGRKFKIRTGHQALIWLFSLKEPKDRIARWIEILSPFDFSVEYGKKSTKMQIPCPDCVTRLAIVTVVIKICLNP
ncbi:unnamed protein product [Mytilus coruscus]|uniref:Reverse transcriptase RNase H-like domain-containing protein n=1 Tax=Mytilus coruscus TaxID=42192 RepID=A0A6J8BUA5_MYTCO|nr:unnamed protein product [Mytilus coruscus]